MIDINTLTIGSHVLFDGERAEVRIISSTQIAASTPAHLGLVKTTPADFSPIPITEELLAELGFEKKEEHGLEQWEKYIGEDLFVYIKHHPKTRRYRAEIIDEVKWINYGNILCYDLHTLEAFVYHTTKLNLIEE